MTKSAAEGSSGLTGKAAAFIWAVALAGAAVAVVAALQWRSQEPAVLIILAVFAAASVRFDVSLINSSRASVAVAPILAAGSIAGLPGIVFVSLSAELAAGIGRRSQYYKSLFNAGAMLVSGAAYVGIINLLPDGTSGTWPALVYATLLGTLAHLVINSAIVATVIAWSKESGEGVLEGWTQSVRPLMPHYVMLGVLVACMASAYSMGSILPMTFVFLPVVITRLAMNIQQSRADLEKEYAASQHLAYHDPLTDLPNRRLFEERMAAALSSADAAGQMMAVLFLDLDEFKAVNDRFGHSSGDRLLQDVARRLRNVTRESDLVARVGGDEFLFMSEDVTDLLSVVRLATRVLDSLHGRWAIDGQTIDIKASVGVAIFPKDGEDARTLLKNADTAMYRAKWLGGDQFKLHEPVPADGEPPQIHRTYALAQGDSV